jgi:hypothetical protein
MDLLVLDRPRLDLLSPGRTDRPSSFDPGSPPTGGVIYFAIVGQTAASEGSYARSGTGLERPEATGIGACDVGQSLTASCDP